MVPVRPPVPATGHTHVDPPHRDGPARCVAVYRFGLAAAYPITWEQYGHRYDVRAILAVDLTSICIWQRRTSRLIPEGTSHLRKCQIGRTGHGYAVTVYEPYICPEQ